MREDDKNQSLSPLPPKIIQVRVMNTLSNEHRDVSILSERCVLTVAVPNQAVWPRLSHFSLIDLTQPSFSC